MEKPVKDWGRGIPKYTKDDVLSHMELQAFCVDIAAGVLEQEGFSIDGANVENKPTLIFASKGKKQHVAIVAGDVFPYKGKIPFAMKKNFSEFCKKRGAIPMLVSIGIMSDDFERAAAELALKYDKVKAFKEIEYLSKVTFPNAGDEGYREYVLEHIIDAYSTGRFEKIYQYFADDIVYRSQWVITPLEGKSALIEYMDGKGRTLRESKSKIAGSVVALRKKHDMTQLLKMFDEKPVTCALLRQEKEASKGGYTWILAFPKFNENNMISEIILCDPARYSIKPYHAFE